MDNNGIIATHAGIAQLVEQLICNHQVASSILAAGTSKINKLSHPVGWLFLLWGGSGAFTKNKPQ